MLYNSGEHRPPGETLSASQRQSALSPRVWSSPQDCALDCVFTTGGNGKWTRLLSACKYPIGRTMRHDWTIESTLADFGAQFSLCQCRISMCERSLGKNIPLASKANFFGPMPSKASSTKLCSCAKRNPENGTACSKCRYIEVRRHASSDIV